MSSRKFGTLRVGVGTPYRDIAALIEDKERVELMADALQISYRNIGRDDCDWWIIRGKGGHIQPKDNRYYGLYVDAYSRRKWGAIKRKAKFLGWDVVHDHDEGGTFCLLGRSQQNEPEDDTSTRGKSVDFVLGPFRATRRMQLQANAYDKMEFPRATKQCA